MFLRHQQRINEFIGQMDKEPMTLENDRPIHIKIDQNYRFRHSVNYQSEAKQQMKFEKINRKRYNLHTRAESMESARTSIMKPLKIDHNLRNSLNMTATPNNYVKMQNDQLDESMQLSMFEPSKLGNMAQTMRSSWYSGGGNYSPAASPRRHNSPLR